MRNYYRVREAGAAPPGLAMAQPLEQAARTLMVDGEEFEVIFDGRQSLLR